MISNGGTFNAEWLSAGLGSVSCINGRRGGRVREMADYVKWVDGGAVLEEEVSRRIPILLPAISLLF